MQNAENGEPLPEIGDRVAGFKNKFGDPALGMIVRENYFGARVAPDWAWAGDEMDAQLQFDDYDFDETVDEFLVVLDNDRERWNELPMEEKLNRKSGCVVDSIAHSVKFGELTWDAENSRWMYREMTVKQLAEAAAT